jgi:hypothetical protein
MPRKQVSYDDLFVFLDEKLCRGAFFSEDSEDISQEDFQNLIDELMSRCDRTFRHTKAFARRHGLFLGELTQMLERYGGRCDCLVLLNVAFGRGSHLGDQVIQN